MIKGAARSFVVLTSLLAASLPNTIGSSAAQATKHYVVWSPRGLPANTGRSLEKISGVRATPVILGLDWLMRSWMPDGSKIDSPPEGYGYPFEIAVVNPDAYARYVPTEYRDVVRSLGSDEALISRSEARLRDAGEGLRLGLKSGRLDVKAVVPDRVTQGYEAITGTAPSWSYRVRFYIVQAPGEVAKERLRKAVSRAAGDIPFEVVGTAAEHLRYAPDVRPQATFKRVFGEYPARPSTSGSFTIWPRWVGRHIRTESVPILGRVTCHRKLLPQMRGALQELRDKGLAQLVRPSEYAGCYNPRFVATPPGVRLSRHSWGIAFDINTSNNQFGQEPHQDPRLVRVMRKWGLLWGGQWPVPDGMHFEWTRFPR